MAVQERNSELVEILTADFIRRGEKPVVAFFAYLSADLDNVIGDGTGEPYKINLNSVVWDYGNQFDTATNYRLDAPVAGVYHFDISLVVHDLTSSHNYIYPSLYTSNQTFYGNTLHAGNNRYPSDGSLRVSFSCDAYMDVNDIAYLQCGCGGGTKVVDITSSVTGTYMSCHFVG